MEENSKAKNALVWIKAILEKEKAIFQVSGGLAAKIYGSPRPLADIDIEVPSEMIEKIFPLVKEYVKFGPEQYHDNDWDIALMTLSYNGQDIDISGAPFRIFDKLEKKWASVSVDFSKVKNKEIWDIRLPVVPKEDLIEYKVKLGRDVDIEDVKAIS